MMKTVQILLSSYNGEKYISRQIDSILRQKDVEIHLLIRDDGSTDGTRAIIKEYEKKYPANVEVVLGENMGWKKSFFTLLQLAGDYDYYAFADQDDYWYEDKEISSIKVMEAESRNYNLPQLVQTQYTTTDELLNPIIPQPPNRPVIPKYHDEIFAEEFFQGCCMTWNNVAMNLIKKYTPQNEYAHDHWVGVVCYLLGKIYFIQVPKFSYVRHSGNASITGNQLAGQIARLKRFLHGDRQLYYNMGDDLLRGYKESLNNHDKVMCIDLINYKHSIKKKIKLLFNYHLRRRSIRGSLFFKFSILLNRF